MFPDHLHVGTRKGWFELQSSANGWKISKTAFLGAQVPMFVCDAEDQFLLVALQHGHFGAKVHRSRDLGESWSEVTTPAFPPKPDDVPDIVDAMRNVVVPWSLELIWALERSKAGTVWCGSIPGGLFRSDDDGDSWQLVRSLWDQPERKEWFGGGYDFPGIHSICIDPRDPRVIRVAISCGGVWVSENDGQNWQCQTDGMRAAYVPPDRANDPNIQDPHCMVQCAGAADHFWVQHHNGIFYSANTCRQWVELEDVQPSSFGFAVAVHPTDPATAWFAPAISDELRYPTDGRFVITRTRDGGQTFEVCGQGLPQHSAYDLIYRHAMAVDRSGDNLAIGSTTGNLWASGDAGDSWQLVSSNLPPINCLQWAE